MGRFAGHRDMLLGLAAGGALGIAALHLSGFDRATLAQGLSSLVLTSPHAGARLSGTVVLTAISGSADIEGIQFQVSGVTLGPEITQGPCTAAWNTTAGTDGPYTLTVIGRDSDGRRSSSLPMPVTVNNSGGGAGTPGNGIRRPRIVPEPSKLPTGRRGGGDRGGGDGGGSAALPSPKTARGRGAAPATTGGCTTPDPYANVAGVIGACVNGAWVAIKKTS